MALATSVVVALPALEVEARADILYVDASAAGGGDGSR